MSSLILIILSSILFLVLSKFRLKLAVALMIFALPSYLVRFKVFGVPFTFLELMILIAFGVWLWEDRGRVMENIRKRIKYSQKQERAEKLIRYPFDAEIIILLLVSFASIVVAGFSDSALGVWKAYFFEPVLVYILILNVFRKSDQKDIDKYFVLPLILSALVVSIFAIYQKITGSFITNDFWAAEETRRVTSFFEYPNAVGLYLGSLVLLMTGWLVAEVKKIKLTKEEFFKKDNLKIYLTGLTIILSCLSIYFAKSEGALLAVALVLIIFGLFVGKKFRYVTVALVVLLSLFIFVNPQIRDKVAGKIMLRDLSGEIRKQQWRETWQLLTASKSNFVLGVGLSNYQASVAPYHQEGIFFNKDNDDDFRRKIVIFDEKYKAEHWQPVETYMYPHDIFLNFWVELGFFGMILFIYLFGKFFYISFLMYKKTDQKYFILGISGAMLVLVIHGLVDVPYFKNDLAVIFWLFFAMIALIEVRKQISGTNEI